VLNQQLVSQQIGSINPQPPPDLSKLTDQQKLDFYNKT